MSKKVSKKEIMRFLFQKELEEKYTLIQEEFSFIDKLKKERAEGRLSAFSEMADFIKSLG